MGFNSKIIIIAVSISILQCIEGALIATKPNTGCHPINPTRFCFWFYRQCDAKRPCSGIEICCPNECGTSCRVPDYYTQPNPTFVCPPIDHSIQCVRFNEECNSNDKQCPTGSICCTNTCDAKCFGPNGEYVPNDIVILE